MTSHELARLLLTLPDLPVATHADNHTAIDDTLDVCHLETYAGPQILIGNPSRKLLNPPNWYITKIYHGGDIPDQW